MPSIIDTLELLLKASDLPLAPLVLTANNPAIENLPAYVVQSGERVEPLFLFLNPSNSALDDVRKAAKTTLGSRIDFCLYPELLLDEACPSSDFQRGVASVATESATS